MERLKEILAQNILEYTQKEYPDVTLEDIKKGMEEEKEALDIIFDSVREWLDNIGIKKDEL